MGRGVWYQTEAVDSGARVGGGVPRGAGDLPEESDGRVRF